LLIANAQQIQIFNFEVNQSLFARETASVCARQDPHNQHQVGYCSAGNIVTLDKRSGKDSLAILGHEDACLQLSFNPNKLHTIASCGADSMTRVWDLRKAKTALLEFEEFGHWTSCLAYNQFHDQLLLTGGSSTFLHFYRAQSVSSLPLQGDLEQTFNMSVDFSERSFKQAPGADKLILRMELEDSVVAVDWSQKDAWVFAAGGYNGSMVVGTVPSKEKYRILL
jgi:WD40 repeat protein